MENKYKTKKERASNLIISNKENAVEMVKASKVVAFKMDKKGKLLDTLIHSNLENALSLSIASYNEFEIQNKEKEKEKEKKIKELIQANERAEESDRLKTAFLANISHEIRTPMNSILGFADLLKEPGLRSDKQLKYIKILEKSGARLLNTINDIVDISKIQSGQAEINLKETNINKQIEKIYAFFKPEVEGKGIQFSFKNSLPAKDAFFITDCEKIYAVLIHLIKNALKYTEKGSIEFGYGGIKSTSSKTELLFFVKDTGIGIPKNRQKAIFENFVQADITDKMALQGNGLGLSISKAYVVLLGGNIWAESNEGKGSEFYFTLPYRIDLEEKILRKMPLC